MARRGYVVHGIDASPELIDIAKRSINEVRASVLNDFVDADSRVVVFTTFARALRPAGVLILDVREWEATAVRKGREPVFRRSVDTDRGKLIFTSITELDREHRRLILSERHTLITDGQERCSDYQFVMRCWTREELESALAGAGFGEVAYFGAYDPAVDVGRTDRLVAVAQLSRTRRSS